jgi:hypothetical protein
MTRFGREHAKCAVCASMQAVQVLQSTHSSGSSGLDGRPAGQSGWAHTHGISECTTCGYSAPNLAKAPTGLDAALLRRLDSGPRISGVASRWHRWSRINEELGDHATAGWGALSAAWATDPDGRSDESITHRRRAAEQFTLALEHGHHFAETPDVEEMIRIDILRVSGQFTEAMSLLEEQSEIASELMRHVAEFERYLIGEGDRASYTVADAESFSSGDDDWRTRRTASDLGCWLILAAIALGAWILVWQGLKVLLVGGGLAIVVWTLADRIRKLRAS